MFIVGIDYSLSSPAVCVLGEDSHHFLFFSTRKKHAIVDPQFACAKPPKKDADSLDFTRYRFLASTVVTFISRVIPSQSPFRVFVEGYSYGSKGRVFEIGENQAILINSLFEAWGGWPDRLSPAEVKKFATGSGNSNKETMIQSFVKETGIDIQTKLGESKIDAGPISDIADAYWVARTGQSRIES